MALPAQTVWVEVPAAELRVIEGGITTVIVPVLVCVPQPPEVLTE